ncbi:MAG: helix-turn-helix domain-containing protein [Cyclobacteriaceae bacterium]
MKLHIYQPENELKEYIRSVIYYSGYTCQEKYETILPDGTTQLIIELDNNARVICLDKNNMQESAIYRNSWITGIFTRPLTYESEQNATTICVQFEPHAIHRFLNLPATALADSVVETELITGKEILDLRNRLINCPTVPGTINLLLSYLEKKLSRSKSRSFQCAEIINSPTFTGDDLQQLSFKSGISQKHFIKRFSQTIGITPKKFQTIQKIKYAIELLNSGSYYSMAGVAIEAGFYDQSHFISIFKKTTGLTPSRYHSFSKAYPHVIAFS